MDHFADHQAFLEVGSAVQNSFLEAAIPSVYQKMFGQKIKFPRILIIHIPEYRFFHGPLPIPERIGGFIYYEDIKVGMLAISESLDSDMVKYSRFSGTLKPPKATYHNN